MKLDCHLYFTSWFSFFSFIIHVYLDLFVQVKIRSRNDCKCISQEWNLYRSEYPVTQEKGINKKIHKSVKHYQLFSYNFRYFYIQNF